MRYRHDKKPLYIASKFKLHGESIMTDLGDAKVRYGQLHLLICWSMNEKKLRDKGFVIDTISGKKNELPDATHKLSFPLSAGIQDQLITVICLSDLTPTT